MRTIFPQATSVLRNCAPSIHVRTRRFFLTRRLCECQLWGGAGHRLPDDL